MVNQPDPTSPEKKTTTAESINFLLQNDNEYGGRLDVTPNTQLVLENATTAVTLLTSLLAGVFLFAAAFGDLLANYEWFQNWRYLWPLVGVIYTLDGYSALVKGDELLKWNFSKSKVVRGIELVGGILTVVGGAYDAFMPVWMTGPNLFTNAGIGQDGAAILFLWTLLQIYQQLYQECREDANSQQDTPTLDWVLEKLKSEGVLLPQILLMAQLYKLGEGSFDEIFSNMF